MTIIIYFLYWRDLRLALLISICLTTGVSILASTAYSCVLTKEEMIASPAVAVVSGEEKIIKKF